MKTRIITSENISMYEQFLKNEEKSCATIKKYMHDLNVFTDFSGGGPIDKQLVMMYKSDLKKRYTVASTNSMLAALNSFLRFAGWQDCCVKQFKTQKRTYWAREEELTKGEYVKLINTAKNKGDIRLELMLQTICCTGIRVSELEFITVESLCQGEAEVNCKGKNRRVFLIPALCAKLKVYAKERNITSGPVFITRNGQPVNRCNIWRNMKILCREAGLPEQKVYPHNLRHLFARTFYEMEKDIAKLADVLGHTNINTTRIYVISTGEEHKRKMESMGLVL